MNSKKILFLILFTLFGFGFLRVAADSYLSLEQFLSSYLTLVTKELEIPQTYKDISLKYKNVSQSSPLYDVLQKAVYANLFPNADLALPLDKRVTQDQIFAIITPHFSLSIDYEKGKLVTSDWLRTVLFEVQDALAQDEEDTNVIHIEFDGKNSIDDTLLNSVYEKLRANYINPKNLTGKDMMYNAVKGMVEGIKDPYTVFFPPTEAQGFNEELEGAYEGIGAYVDMIKPGELMIISPVMGSPAEKAGLLAGDRIIQINEHKITEKTDITVAVSWIKGLANTSVTLKVLRAGKSLTFTIMRETVTLKNVYAKTYSGNVCYMSINMFGYGVYDEFVEGITTVFAKKGTKCTKYVFDMRNNPGGSLEEVGYMLDYFVPTGKPSVIVKSKVSEEIMTAEDSPIKLTDKNVVVLINEGSASAAEIFAGTIKDYLPHSVLMGKKSFGKGSVQELLQYSDGSMLKYTVAKRYTGKTQTSIDHTGLLPDVEVSDNVKTAADEQLDAALKYKFK